MEEIEEPGDLLICCEEMGGERDEEDEGVDEVELGLMGRSFRGVCWTRVVGILEIGRILDLRLLLLEIL